MTLNDPAIRVYHNQRVSNQMSITNIYIPLFLNRQKKPPLPRSSEPVQQHTFNNPSEQKETAQTYQCAIDHMFQQNSMINPQIFLHLILPLQFILFWSNIQISIIIN